MANRLVVSESQVVEVLSDRDVPRFYSRYRERSFHYLLQSDHAYLHYLAHEITRQPNRLSAHVQRIHYCYRKGFDEHMFAALTDLLIVLNGRGQAIARRMITGCRRKLLPEQLGSLTAAVQEGPDTIATLAGNSFSLLTKGRRGVSRLLEKSQATVEDWHDPLQLARDAIEYSQLDEAKRILENALVEEPERSALHDVLLELYRSTGDRSGFERTLASLRAQVTDVPSAWRDLQSHFERLGDVQ